MKKQVFNPFLPLDEYIPDGEPHVFGDRVYLYGSHEAAGADTFCNLDYVVYSAPVTDLKDWRYEGISYKACQDPLYSQELKYMYAPDVVKGNDGKYYLYYCMAGYRGKGGYGQPISVAVSESPAGQFKYYGQVKNADGSVFRQYVSFDPALINDNGVIRLYYGTWFTLDELKQKFARKRINQVEAGIFNRTIQEIESDYEGLLGACTVTLSDDMLTVSSKAVKILSARKKGTPYYQHPFFEGSSIRKIANTYYFIYSSLKNHELCYATSTYPDKEFVFRGVIISNGDIGLNGRTEKQRLNFTGTNHGSIELINGKWYVFYHRLTHKSAYSRQACAEEIKILADGSIPQVEITSCGLNGSALIGEGEYPAVIACNLTNGKMPHSCNDIYIKDIPFILENNNENVIASIKNATCIGYKYFSFKGKTEVSVCVKGNAIGVLKAIVNQDEVGEINLTPSENWCNFKTTIDCFKIGALLFKFKGKGKFQFKSFKLKLV